MISVAQNRAKKDSSSGLIPTATIQPARDKKTFNRYPQRSAV